MTSDASAGDARRTSRIWALAVTIPVTLLLSALLVFSASFSAFTAQTATGSIDFRTGSVSIDNDRAGHVVFAPGLLQPGDSGEADITLTYSGTLDAEVRLLARVAGGDQDLAPHIDLTITRQGGGAPWVGTLAAFQLRTEFADGILPFTMTEGRTEVFTIAYRVSTATVEGVWSAPPGTSASVVFAWEALGISA